MSRKLFSNFYAFLVSVKLEIEKIMERGDKKEKHIQFSKGKHKRLLSSKMRDKDRHRDEEVAGLPHELHNRLQNLFLQIEKEFIHLHYENVNCK